MTYNQTPPACGTAHQIRKRARGHLATLNNQSIKPRARASWHPTIYPPHTQEAQYDHHHHIEDRRGEGARP